MAKYLNEDGVSLLLQNINSHINKKASNYLPLTGGYIDGNVYFGSSSPCSIYFYDHDNAEYASIFAGDDLHIQSPAKINLSCDELLVRNSNNEIGNIDGIAAYATSLETHRYIDGVKFDGTADITHHGSSSTGASTAAKTVSITDFSLKTGSKISVKFTNANSAANPTLNVSSTGAKTIRYNGSNLPSTQYWAAGAVVEFIYDGTYWNVVGTIKDNNTTYSAATATASGLVSTGAQTFGGTKTFSTINTNTINDNGGILSIINNNTGNNSNDYVHIESTNGQINLSSKNGVYVNDISGNPGTIVANLSGKLTTSRTIDGVSFDGSANITHFGVCSTDAGTQTKVVSCTGFVLATGARILVKFTNGNTYTTLASTTLKLNVNSTGAKDIKYHGLNINTLYHNITTNEVIEFVYDGTNYNIVGILGDGSVNVGLNTTSTEVDTQYILCTDDTAIGVRGSINTYSGLSYVTSTNTLSTNITGSSASAAQAGKLSTARTIDGVSFDGSKNITNYYYCESVQASDKAINLSGFTLSIGARIVVKFKYPNKANDNIIISNVGTYPIHYRGQTLQAGFWTAYQCVEFIFDGTQFNIVAGTPYSTTSDERLKDIIGDSNKLNLDVIANAPSKIYSLKDDYFKTEYIGTIAQYWEDKVPQAILHHGENLGVDYAPLALCSAITLAREVVELKEKIKELESKLSK